MMDVEALITDCVRRVAELPDRTSPDDQPEMMLVTAEELAAELRAFADEVEAAAIEKLERKR